MSLSPIATSVSASTFPGARAGAAHPAAGRREMQGPQEMSSGAPAGPRQLRSALTDTLAATVGGSADLASEAVRDALGDFTAELFDALRAEGGREVGHGPGRHLQRGHAWGHYRGADLATRIETLSATLGAGGTAPAASGTSAAAAGGMPVDGAVAAVTEPVATEPTTGPAAPEAVTTAPAPVATLASALETSFATLWQALNPDAGDAAAGADLASFLNALALRLRGGGEAPAPVGSLIDITA